VIASVRSLVIFANAPEKGRVKSRIAADLGPEVALTAYKTLAEHAVAAASQVDWCRKTIAYAPNGTGEAMRSWFGDLFDCPYCVGHWLCWGATAIYRPRLVTLWLPLDLLVTSFVMIAAAAVVSGLIGLARRVW